MSRGQGIKSFYLYRHSLDYNHKMHKMVIAVIQMTSVDSEAKNLNQILMLLKSIEGKNVAAVFLPENCLYMRIKEGSTLPPLQLDSPIFFQLQAWVDQNDCALHLGSVPLIENSKLFNSSVWIEPRQAPRPSYRKIHLFDIALEGQKKVSESDVFSPGQEPAILSHLGWNFGQSVCYDLRFSELYAQYAKQEVDAILIPSSFLVPTGKAHWETLVRARAIESQCYVIASAQSGTHQSVNGSHSRQTFGHSLIVSPWGEKLVEMVAQPEIQIFEIEKEAILKVRTQMPMRNHRRLIVNKT